MKTEAYFMSHCDDNSECDLGCFWYTCPVCGKRIDDYDVWWKRDEIMDGTPEKFECEECKTQLIVKWDSYQYYVENNNK
jgi:DNA-directed RNA polymerase subunit RPC12/RpoP